MFYLSAVIRRKTARTAIISQILRPFKKNCILTNISLILLDHIGVHHSYDITSAGPDHYCCLAHITLLRLRNKYLRTNLRRRYADLFHQVGKIISLSSPSLANTDGFITEFYMICYNTLSTKYYFKRRHCRLCFIREGQIVLQQAMSPVISPVLLLNAGSNSLYLHSFIALTLHLLRRSNDHFGVPGSRILRLSIRPPTARCHTNTQTSSHLITIPASHIPPFHGAWPHVPVISWTPELTKKI